MDIQLLALDLDGTSLQADHQSFTPRLHQALADAHAQGVIIVPTTGRQQVLLPPPIHTGAAWENLCILCNGGEIRRIATGELLRGHYVPPQTAAAVVKLAGQYDLPVELSAQGHMYLTQESWDKELPYREFIGYHLDVVLGQNGVVVEDLAQTAHTPGLNIDKIHLPHIPDEVYPSLTAQLDTLPLNYFPSGLRTMEIAPSASAKGNALLEVCELLGVDPAHTMAMGDSGNDVSMLQAAGFSVAMGNAQPHIQALADAVTLPYDQDGAAIAIERYILHK